MNRLDIRTSRGIPFRVVMVPAGTQPPNRPLMKPLTETIVEFYDASRPVHHAPDGWFIADYYVSSLLDSDRGYGLNLYSNEADLSIDADTMKLVLAWIQHHLERI